MGIAIGIGIGVGLCISLVQETTWIILTSGLTSYRRGMNYAISKYVLEYSSDGGSTWETIVYIDPSEDSIIIDPDNLYRHRIVGTSYHIDQTLTVTGYAGVEDLDWENIYQT